MFADLSATPFAEVIRCVSADRRSGDLEVRHEETAKTVFFDRGRLIFAASNLKEDRLGEALVASGRISEADFERVSALMKEKGRRLRFGEALIEAGLMDPEELGVSVARQVRQIVLSLFALPAGVASFEERTPAIPLEYRVGLSVHRLLYVGIRGMTDQALVRKGLGDLSRAVMLSRVPPFRFVLHKCPVGELRILEECRRRVTLRELVAIPSGLSVAKARAIYALLASGVLEDTDTPRNERAEPVVHTETGTFLLSSLQRRSERPSRRTVREEVTRQIEQTSRLDVDAWLRVTSREDVTAALEEKMERYCTLLEAAADDCDLRRDIEVVLGRAWVLLRKARGPAAVPPAAQARPAPPIPLQRAAVAATPAETPARPAVSQPGTQPPVRSTAPAPTQTGPLVGTRPVQAAPPAAAPPTTAKAEPPRPSPPVTATGTGPVRVAAVQAPLAPGAAGGGTAAAPPPAEKRAAEVEAKGREASPLEKLLKAAELRMAIKDFGSAAQLLSRVVEMEPKAAGHRLRLAQAMTGWPPLARQAEREFLEAAHLEPNNPTVHFEFGLYYKYMRLRNRAVAEFRATLFLDPQHKDARKELEVLSPRDSALTTMQKRLS